MKKTELKNNLTIIITMLMIIVIILLNIRTIYSFSRFGAQLIDDKLHANINSLELCLEVFASNTKSAAVSMAENPAAIQAISAKDRQSLLRIFNSTFDLYDVGYYTITDAQGIVIARTHEPDEYGDPVTNQQNVANALNGTATTCFEAGTVVKVSVRTGAPVYDTEGNLVGVISAGVRLDTTEAVDSLSEILGSDVSVFFADERIATTIMDGDNRAAGRLDPQIAETVLENAETYANEIVLFGSWYEAYYKPLINPQGEVFAAICLGIPINDLRSESNTLLLEVLLIGAMCIVISAILLRALIGANAANNAKTAFLSTMSHEIRTPMNAILGVTEILLRDSNINKETKTSLEKIYASGDLLLGIINDILDLSKIEAGKLELVTVDYEIASLVSDTAQLNMMRIGSKPIEFEIYVDENVPQRVSGDELRVKQILNNLLSNAFKYTKEGKVTLNVSAEEPRKTMGTADVRDQLHEKPQEGIIVFTVTDTGQGMTVEQIAKLGNEYTRFNSAANRTTEGTGLGMNITRSLINMMNGSILVESLPGKGSTFTVKLPQGIVSDETIGKEVAENLRRFRTASRSQMKRTQIKYEYMPYGKVMVVDDVETNIYVARGLLAPYGLDIDSAESGPEAIEKLKEGNTYDIVFMDHMMPEMDGVEATGIIREMGYKEPIVALTANAVAGQAEMFLEVGFDDFISKPIDMRQMNAILKKYVRDKQPPEVIRAAQEEHEKFKRNNKDAPRPLIGFDIDRNIAEIFVRDASKALVVLDKIIIKKGKYDDDDLRLFTISTHGMKAPLEIIGEQKLSETARSLESLGREKNTKVIAEETPAFTEALRVLVEKVRYELKDEHTSESQQTQETQETADENTYDSEYLTGKLQDIKKACNDFDTATAEEIVRELRNKKWPADISERLADISAHLLHSDFDEVTETIDEMLKAES